MRVHSSVMPPPVVVGDGLIFACQGDVFALDAADGSVRHRYGPRGVHRVASYGGRLYVATNHVDQHTVHALAVADGITLWRFAEPGRIQGPPVIGDRIVYASIVEGAVVALSAADGSLLWRHETGPLLFAEPHLAADRLYISAAVNQPAQPTVVALDARLGRVRWSAELPESSTVPLAAADNAVYAATHSGCAAFGASDGAQLWRQDLNALASQRRAGRRVFGAGRAGRGSLSELR